MQENFQQTVMRELKRLVDPLMAAAGNQDAANDFFKQLGWDLTQLNPSSNSDLIVKLNAIATAYNAVDAWVQTPPTTFQQLGQALNDAKSLFSAIKLLQNTTGTSLLQDFNKLGKDLSDLLITNYLFQYHPTLFNALVLLGLIEHSSEQQLSSYVFDPSAPSNIVRLPFKIHRLHLDRISSMVSDPKNYFQQEFQIGSGPLWANTAAAKYTADKLFPRLVRLLNGLDVQSSHGFSSNPNLNITFGADGNSISERSMLVYYTSPTGNTEFGLCFSLSDATTGDLGLVITPFGSISFNETFGDWNIALDISSAISALAIAPGEFTFPNNVFDINGTVEIKKQPEEDGTAFLVGSTNGTHLSIEEISFGGDFTLSNEIREYGAYLQITNASIVIAPGDGDSFLQKVFPSGGLNSEFSLKIMWSNVGGFHLEGSGSLELELPIHKTFLNALTIDTLTAKLEASTSLALIAAISGSLKLGPFTGVFQEVGLKFDVDFPPDKDGNLGALDVSVDFKPPKGLGLSVNTDTFTGGGFLSFDKDAGRYVGSFELSVKKKISIKVFGILTTKLPGGQPGYSLLLSISAEFQPIQLGFGFTLNGVGGLIALHRRMDRNVLADGVKNNSLDNILFPKQPVANINNIISSMEKAFPIDEDRFTFGPMAIIGWGTPTLITAELGLFIEVPDPVQIALIGVIRAMLPSESNALVRLQINFIGTISFEEKLITFNASLFDSSLLGLTLNGDMAFRLRWGANPGFALSVGGFYPGFQMPGFDLPSMNRLSLTLHDGNPRLIISMYFAVTSNTLQFGASADFYYKVNGKLNIDGNVGFDVLVRFTPFHFTGVIKGGLSVNWKGDSIMGLWFEGTLDGPTPWELQGSVSFKIGPIGWDVDFSKRWGREQVTSRPDLDVLTLLNPALIDPKNWQATLPETLPQLVTIRDLSAASGVVVFPHGKIAVNQKITPLDFKLQHYGNKNLLTHHSFSIDIMDPANPQNALSKIPLQEYFSPGEILELSESDKLSYPSFELYNSGLQVQETNNAFTAGSAYYEMREEYEYVYMDQPHRVARENPNIQFTAQQKSRLVNNNSTGNSPIGVQQKNISLYAPPAASVQQGTYAIAQTYDLSTYNGYTANSRVEAQVMLNELLAQNPELEGKLDVVHSFETF